MPVLDGIRVLLVDDEPDAREVMASALESCGATVISAASAREALETLAAHGRRSPARPTSRCPVRTAMS